MSFISVIIPTRNRADRLILALDSLYSQNFEPDKFEIIVVDNGSSDNTKDTAMLFKNKFKNFSYVFEEKKGLHIGRNLGMKLSKGNIIAYIDDDVKVGDKWLEGISETFQNPETALAGGNNFPDFETAPPVWFDKIWNYNEYGKYVSIFSILDFGNQIKEINPVYVWGCNYIIRKNVLMKICGFHPDSMPDELLKYRGDGETYVSKEVKKMNYKIMFNPKISVYHFVPQSRMTFEYIRKRCFMQGISDSYFYTRQKGCVSNKLAVKILWNYLKFLKDVCLQKYDFFQQIQKKSYFNGWLFHQVQLRKDKNLINWVMKEEYNDL
ncbi:glycosyltransferase [Candidatus Dependentiae bacterium]|nr:glycosyltransferase [Candidatus Dependentiae bacterium]